MRIAMISSYFAPYLYGGAEVYLRDLTAALRNRGHDVHIITNNPGHPHDDPAVTNLDTPPNIALRAFLIPQPAIVNAIKQRLNEIQPDIVHVHCTHTTLGFAPFAALSGRPAIATIHEYSLFCLTGKNARVEGQVCNDRRHCASCASTFYPEEIERASKSLSAQVAGNVLRHVRPLDATVVAVRNVLRADYLKRVLARVVCPSRAVAQTMEVWGLPAEMVRVVPNGIPDMGEPTERVAQRSFTVGFVGRLVRAKGVHLLIEAIGRLRADGHDIRLLVAGDGEVRADLEAQAAASLGTGYRFTGWLDASGVRAVYEAIDVMAFPVTWVEAFGIALLEAMGRKIPVVASDIGGIPEVLAHGGGLLFKSGSVDGLIGALSALFDPAVRAVIGEEGRAAFLGHYTLEHNVDSVESIYADTSAVNGPA